MVFTKSERMKIVMGVSTDLKTRPYYPDPKPQKRFQDKGFLKYVAMQRCLYCGITPVQVHHVRKYGWGAMGRKPGDYFCIPLCHEHHDMAHNDPERFGRVIGIEEITEAIFTNIQKYVVFTGGDLEGFFRTMAESAVDWMKEER